MSSLGAARRSLDSLRGELDAATDVDHDELARVVADMRATMPNHPGGEAAARDAVQRLPARWREPMPDEWNPAGGIRYHPEQAAARLSDARHRCIEAGRRSGKSEDRKREIVIAALDPEWFATSGQLRRFIVVGCPTQDQTEELYFDDLRSMIPPQFVKRIVYSKPKTIETVIGGVIKLAGMDRPQRAEGKPIDDLFLDEFADMKPEVWDSHLAPSLSTPGRPPGRVTFFGTPDLKSGAHFVDLCDLARDRMLAGDHDWAHFHWPSKGIVSDDEWVRKQRDMDPAQFAVEYEARRVSTGNLCYYNFARESHVVSGLQMMPDRPLLVCCDFNWDPGTAVIAQEQTVVGYLGSGAGLPANTNISFTAVLGEVFIRRSNTPEVMEAVAKWIDDHGHAGAIHVYGDPAGRQHKSSAQHTDIDLIERVMGPKFGRRLQMRFHSSHPPIRDRVNAMNQRFRTGAHVSMVVDAGCRELIRDLELVQWKDGAAFEVLKPNDGKGKLRSHLVDGLGYYIAAEHPVGGSSFRDEIW